MNAPANFAGVLPLLDLYAVRDGLSALARLLGTAEDPPPPFQTAALVQLLAQQLERVVDEGAIEIAEPLNDD